MTARWDDDPTEPVPYGATCDCISVFGPHKDHRHCEWMLAHPRRPFTIRTKASMKERDHADAT